jgi:hypothetical protein
MSFPANVLALVLKYARLSRDQVDQRRHLQVNNIIEGEWSYFVIGIYLDIGDA